MTSADPASGETADRTRARTESSAVERHVSASPAIVRSRQLEGLRTTRRLETGTVRQSVFSSPAAPVRNVRDGGTRYVRSFGDGPARHDRDGGPSFRDRRDGWHDGRSSWNRWDGRHDDHYRWDRAWYVSRRCPHGHYGSCYICSRRHGSHSGLYVSFGWGWPYYGSFTGWDSWCGLGYGVRVTWPYYWSTSCYLWPYYSGPYYTTRYYDYDYLAPVQYTNLVYGGVPATVYEELPPVVLPSPAEPVAADAPGSFASELAPMLGGPATVGAAFALGEDSLRRGEFARAVAAFEESVLSGTADPSARIALTLALIGVEDYADAAAVLRLGLEQVPQVSAIAIDVNALFADPTAWQGALDRLRAASQRAPGDADLKLLMGFSLFAGGDLQEANAYLWSAYEGGVRDTGLAEVLLATEARLRALK